MRKYVAALLLSLCSFAHALTIDFEGLAAGSSPGSAYAEQGVTFQGGVIVYNEFGAYVQGPVTMFFNAALAGAGISVLARGMDDSSQSSTWINGQLFERVLIPDFMDPMGRIPIPAGTLFPSIVYTDNRVNEIGFNVKELDQIIFGSTALQAVRRPAFGTGDAIITGEVPEPSGAILFLFGLLALVGWHHQRHLKRIEYRA
jgi:hypothetical protein